MKTLAQYLTAFCLASVPVWSQGAPLDLDAWLDATYLLDIRQGSELSDKVRTTSTGGYELSDGTYQSFKPWYSTTWPDAHITWLTQLTPNFGLIYGLSTGERGTKYTIDPSLKLGFLSKIEVAHNTVLTVKATTIVGGMLREKPCTANFGDIGGIQSVNCRLAASVLPPNETLAFLWSERPRADNKIALTLTWIF